jgi:hypothetical protein
MLYQVELLALKVLIKDLYTSNHGYKERLQYQITTIKNQ